MIRLSTLARISIGLVTVTIMSLLVADIIGLIPNRSKAIISERQKICESLAVYCTVVAQKKDTEMIVTAMQALVERNDDILSAALRREDGSFLVVSDNHEINWKKADKINSTPTHVRVPIFSGNDLWGTLEVSFQSLHQGTIRGIWENSLIRLILFVIIIGFFGNKFFLKRTLRLLDPAKVVPPRVKMAFDSLSEGVVLINQKARIVHVNASFSEKTNMPVASLLGRRMRELGWTDVKSNILDEDLPWFRALNEKESVTGIRLYLPIQNGRILIFKVNSTPILDGSETCRGAIATFDDMTQVEKQNEQLQIMLKKLETSELEIRRQNKALEILATQDPLTGCMNRRSFFEKFDNDLGLAIRHKHDISCIMFDIDHFKNINDTQGHAAGDHVLKETSAILKSLLRKGDILGRYGGEEFVIVLPHAEITGAIEVAERYRLAIEAYDFAGIRITASFGVSSTAFGAIESSALIDQADKALYVAKNGGRNQVISWGQLETEAGNESSEIKLSTDDSTPKVVQSIEKKEDQTNDRNVGNPEKEKDAVRLVSESLEDSAKTSKSMGLHASYDNNGNPAVRLDHDSDWRGEKNEEKDVLHKKSFSKAANVQNNP